MVRTQLERRGVVDARVLAAFREVPRHLFLPARLRDEAYADCAVPIGQGQTISQPFIVGTMLERLALTGTEKALDVGAGSGYQTALLSRLCQEVIGVERLPDLAREASRRLQNLGYDNACIIMRDGTTGYPEEAPFDAIVVGAGSPEVPAPLVEQLAEGGRLLIPVGDRHFQRLTLVGKQGARVWTEEGIGCVFVPLVGEHGWS